jgi:hypothetical protein
MDLEEVVELLALLLESGEASPIGAVINRLDLNL